MALCPQLRGLANRGRHREELHDHVDAPEEEALLPLQLRLVEQDAVKALPRQFATAPLDEAEVRRQRPELAKAKRRGQAFDPQGGIPAQVKPRDLRQGGEFPPEALLRIDHRPRHLEVLVDGFPGHEEMHDLARTLEDEVDSAVAHHPLDTDGGLASATQGALRLVAAATTDLQS